jgi:diguanylate cyclase (GGDEF)-like protein
VDSTVQAAVAVTDGRVMLWLLDEDGSGLELAYDSERGAVPPLESHRSLGVGVVGRSARYGQISRGDPATDDAASVAVPLVVGARVIGVLECFDGVEGEVDGQALSAVEMLATLAGSSIEASRLHAATERLSQYDPLTQLANRRRLGADLDTAVANAKRHGHPMSVIMLDLDHFKELNDRYGHQQGDVVLQEVASTLRASMRDGETAYRYGGEEFAILITQGGPDDAAALAERLRERVEADFKRGGRQLVTASFGIATLPEHAGDGEGLVSEADRALYSAKNSGRNRVHRAGQLVG